MTSYIAVSAVTKSFGRLRAVDQVSVSVAAGEVVGLLGPNGAGKTTLLRTIMGFLNADGGTVSVLGGRVNEPAVRGRIGYLPGDANFDKRMTVGSLLDWYGKLRGPESVKSRTDLVERFQVDESRAIGQLSTGNRRKLGLVQALMHDPDVLVLDEPSAGLDPLVQRELVAVVRERVDAGAAALFSSHILSEVEDVSDRVVMMRAGQVVHETDVANLRAGVVQRIEFRTDAEIPPDLLSGLTGIAIVDVGTHAVTVDVSGSTSELVSRLAPLGVAHVIAHNQDLEDLFFRYYRDDSAPQANGGA